MAAAAGNLSTFNVIKDGGLAEVQRRVEADPSLMEERRAGGRTPVMWAVFKKQSAIALWLIQHRGDHDVNAADERGWAAIHYACRHGPLEIVQEIVAARADVAAMSNRRSTHPMLAVLYGHADIVAFLLSLPAVRDSIDSFNANNSTAISIACLNGRTHIVQLLLNAGANPTIPEGDESPLSLADNNHHHAIVALLTHAIAEPQRSRDLHKARFIVDANFEIRKAQRENRGKPAAEVRRRMVEAAPEYLQARVGRGEQLPRVAINGEEDEDDEEEQAKRRATLAYVLGMAGGPTGDGLPREVFTKLLEMMVPRWDQPGARRP